MFHGRANEDVDTWLANVVGVHSRWARFRLLGSFARAFPSSCVRAAFPPHNPAKRQLRTLKYGVSSGCYGGIRPPQERR